MDHGKERHRDEKLCLSAICESRVNVNIAGMNSVEKQRVDTIANNHLNRSVTKMNE